MNIFEFMNDNPGITVLIIFVCFLVIAGVIVLIQDMVSRAMKGHTIRKNGYPPEYCDAEGDKREH